VSYTQNIGLDGSGVHCGNLHLSTDNIRLNEKKDIRFLDTLYYDKRIINLQYNAFTRQRRPLWQKAINFIARKLGKKAPFVIKKKVYA
jgi:hypothetical protein